MLLWHLVWLYLKGTYCHAGTPRQLPSCFIKWNCGCLVMWLDSNTVKAYFCNLGDTVSLPLSGLACDSFNLASKHGNTLFPAYSPTLLSVETKYLSW